MKIEPSGKVTVLTGTCSHGQGEETTFAQIAADELGVDIDDILVLRGDTAIVHYGIGTFGSRGTAIGGTALYFALQELKEQGQKIRRDAARIGRRLLRERPRDVQQDRQIQIAGGNRGRDLSRDETASEHRAGTAMRRISGSRRTSRFGFGAHIVVTDIDTETGQIKIRRYVAVDDCGNILNPLIVDGQVHGGVAQGLGQALWEQAVYDDNGQLITGEFMDYAMPRAHMMPWIESDHTITPSPVNPLGVKGVGEAGTIGCSPAVVNSVVDALSPLGVRHHRHAADAGEDLETNGGRQELT